MTFRISGFGGQQIDQQDNSSACSVQRQMLDLGKFFVVYSIYMDKMSHYYLHVNANNI